MRFALLLARSLGRTLEELGRSMSAYEFGLWQAAYAAEPWGEWRTDFAGGMVAATIANVNRARNSPSYTPADFMPRFDRQDDAPATPEQLAARLQGKH